MSYQYAKIWTSMFNDNWFISLPCNARGLWIQLVVYAKMVGDTGVVSMRSYSAMAAVCGCDDSSVAKYLRKFAEVGKINLIETGEKSLTIEIVNYDYYQRGDVVSDFKNGENSPKVEKSEKPKSAKIRPIPDQTRPDQKYIGDTACAVRPELQEIMDYYNLKTKRNWKLTDARKRMLKVRLKTFTVDQLKDAIDGITSRPHNLGQNQTNTVYLDFELIFRNDEQVDKYRQDRVAKKTPAVKYWEPEKPQTPEEQERAEAAKRELLQTAREKGILR